jgi:hypothetical protein
MTLFMFHYSECSVYIIQEPCVAMGVQFGSLFMILEKRRLRLLGLPVPNDIDRHGAGVAPLDYTLLLHTIEISFRL